MIEKAIKLCRKYSKASEYFDELIKNKFVKMPLMAKKLVNQIATEILAELEKQSGLIEFTKKWRQRFIESEAFMQLSGAKESEIMKEMREACDLLNRQAEENKLLKEALFEHRWDLHQRSNRPCPTCRQSSVALGLKVPDYCAKEDLDKQALQKGGG